MAASLAKLTLTDDLASPQVAIDPFGDIPAQENSRNRDGSSRHREGPGPDINRASIDRKDVAARLLKVARVGIIAGPTVERRQDLGRGKLALGDRLDHELSGQEQTRVLQTRQPEDRAQIDRPEVPGRGSSRGRGQPGRANLEDSPRAVEAMPSSPQRKASLVAEGPPKPLPPGLIRLGGVRAGVRETILDFASSLLLRNSLQTIDCSHSVTGNGTRRRADMNDREVPDKLSAVRGDHEKIRVRVELPGGRKSIAEVSFGIGREQRAVELVVAVRSIDEDSRTRESPPDNRDRG